MQEATRGKHDFCYALRKFRNPCENFVMHSFSLSQRNFAIIEKICYHSKSYYA